MIAETQKAFLQHVGNPIPKDLEETIKMESAKLISAGNIQNYYVGDTFNLSSEEINKLTEENSNSQEQSANGKIFEKTSYSKIEAMDKTEGHQRDLDAFIISANGETSSRSFQEWAGDQRVTLAIVFTDVVGSTALGEKIGDEAMNEVRKAHFAQSRKLINRFKGREIKTIGDSFMAAFRSADAALDYSLALQEDGGHAQVKIRAGIHIGPMNVEESDVFGGAVNFAARVIGAIKGAEIWLSEPAKTDIDSLGAERHKHLKWEQHAGVQMKGFHDIYTLWSLKMLPSEETL